MRLDICIERNADVTNICSLHLMTGAKQQFVNLDVPKIRFLFAHNVILWHILHLVYNSKRYQTKADNRIKESTFF